MLHERGPAGIEPATCKLQVQLPTAKPPRNTKAILTCWGQRGWRQADTPLLLVEPKWQPSRAPSWLSHLVSSAPVLESRPGQLLQPGPYPCLGLCSFQCLCQRRWRVSLACRQTYLNKNNDTKKTMCLLKTHKKRRILPQN